MRKAPQTVCCARRRGLAVLCAAAVLVSLCLAACSGEILSTESESLSLIPGGPGEPGTGSLGIVTETPTGDNMTITPSGDPYADAAHVMRVDFLNTGNADCILIRMDETVILVDTGESDDYRTVTAAMADAGISRIDHLIITHYDNDHIGTAAQLLKNYAVGHVYMPDYIRDSRLYRAFADTLSVLSDGGKTVVHRLQAEVVLSLDYGQVTVSPTALYEPGLTLGSDDSHALQENNYSLLTTVDFGEISILLAGDAEGERIAEYMAALPEGKADFDVLKIPHHGGYDKELGDLLRAAKGNLRYCMVSVGDASLVDARLVTAMRSAGAGVYYTYGGHIRLSTDGQSMVVEQN